MLKLLTKTVLENHSSAWLAVAWFIIKRFWRGPTLASLVRVYLMTKVHKTRLTEPSV